MIGLVEVAIKTVVVVAVVEVKYRPEKKMENAVVGEVIVIEMMIMEVVVQQE